MKSFRSLATLAAATVGAAATGAFAAPPVAAPAAVVPPLLESRTIDLAICLDTSGSMQGLIDAARQKLWAIVNDLAMARPTPRLRVALLTFGNDGHDPHGGWVAVQTPFTEDLDLVSQKLFALSTNGGTEYVGRVLHNAAQLDWHPGANALKLIVVAGNESADQDQETPFRSVCPQLIARSIIVNSIYCGPAGDNLAPDWKQVALLADGQFASIDQNQGTVVVETPFDAPLGELSAALNATYLPFGERGQVAWINQQQQDTNAASLNSEAVALRCETKGSSLYSNSSWDLVDACRDESFKLAEVPVESLPQAMQAMTAAERAALVAEMSGQRKELQEKIAAISAQREAHVREQMTQRGLDDSSAFDRAIRAAIRSQALAKGFTFDDC